jgi:hypothetical protein
MCFELNLCLRIFAYQKKLIEDCQVNQEYPDGLAYLKVVNY